jgi:chromosome segregation ATPase
MFAGSAAVIPPGMLLFPEIEARTGIPRQTLHGWRSRGRLRREGGAKQRVRLEALELRTVDDEPVFYAALDDVAAFLDRFPDVAKLARYRSLVRRALGLDGDVPASAWSPAVSGGGAPASTAGWDQDQTTLGLELVMTKAQVAELSAELQVAAARIESLEAALDMVETELQQLHALRAAAIETNQLRRRAAR